MMCSVISHVFQVVLDVFYTHKHCAGRDLNGD